MKLFATYGIFVLAELWEVLEEQWERRLEDEILVPMPVAWERRLVQTDEATGEEVALLRRASLAGHWLVATNNRGICQIQLASRRDVRSVSQPRQGVTYTPLKIFTPEERMQTMDQANALYQRGTGQLPVLGLARRGSFWKRWGAACLSAPVMGLRWCRWSFRSSWRAGGLVATVYLIKEGLGYWGFFNFMHGHVTWVVQKLEVLKTMIEESSDWAAGWMDLIGQIYSWTSSIVEPSRIPFILLGLYMGARYLAEIMESSTPLVTPGPSGTQTPVEGDGQAEALQTLASSVDAQARLMENLMTKLVRLEEQQSQRALMRDAENLATDARLEAQREQQSQSWEAMQKRVEEFERILREDKQGVKGDTKDAIATGGPIASNLEKVGDGLGAKNSGLGEDGGGVTTGGLVGGGGSSGDSEMGILIKKLQKDIQTPQEIFVEALKDWKDVDPEVWATHFPPGYRERTSAHTMGEIYAGGTTAKVWGKNFLKSKNIGDSAEAREILPPLCALDAIFLTDKVPGAINQVGVEKLVKKVNGIRHGYQFVEKESDWKKPGNAKSWKSKVDYVQWARTDPCYNDKEHIFINRKAEDEQRLEMERDAALLKAKLKLAGQDK